MFDLIIRASLRYRWLVVLLAVGLTIAGVISARQMPVDVLPDVSAPTVTVVTETTGMAPEEVEKLVSVPLENALGGATGVRRIRSSSGVGISLVWVEFNWDVDVLIARQIVNERLSSIRASLPAEAEPVMAPISSIMGEIMFVGVTGKGVDELTLREVAEWDVRRRLIAVPGVAQVVPIGGAVRQVRITIQPDRLVHHHLGVEGILEALEGFSSSEPGGFYVSGSQEYVVRALGRVQSLETLESVVVGRHDDVPIQLRDVADIGFGPALRRGQAAIDGEHGVVLKIQRQPDANTLELTKRLDVALDDIATSLPKDVQLYRKGFRQATFIRVAVDNLLEVLRDAAILVVVILAMFLMSWRTTLISVLALPLSLFAGLLTLHWFGATINTMTLGGFAIAIGELVDDAIIDVENVHRRLRENEQRPPSEQRRTLDVVYQASREIRTSVVFATVILVLVFLPLFFLEGLEGRLLRPLGIAYIVSIVASLLVAITITPALCMLLLGRSTQGQGLEEGRLAAFLKRGYRPMVQWTLRHPWPIGAASIAGAVAALITLTSLGRDFLPQFNEGALNIAAATAPGTSLETSDEIVARLERRLMENPAVVSVIRSTGRAERDEHALDVNYSEMEVVLDVSADRREEVLAQVREAAAEVPALSITVGQPISHRIDHMVSGVRASLAVKLFGDDLDTLRVLARDTQQAMSTVPGVVDVNVEQLTEVPQLVVEPKPTELAALGLTPGKLSRLVHMIFAAHTVGAWWNEDRSFDVVVALPQTHRTSLELLRSTPIDADGERYAELSDVARVAKTTSPNLINRENGQRRIVVTANIADRDLVSVAEEVQAAVQARVQRPAGYRAELGGQFESEARASSRIVWLSGGVLVTMFILLVLALRSARDALVVLLNVPLSLMGGAVAVLAQGGILTIASLIGFITLFGIATRNGILMVTHFQTLRRQGYSDEQAVIQGSVDRLLPIMMTALTAALALIPIVLAMGEPGNEIQGPMATVILGGLVSSTLLNLLVVPSVYARFGAALDVEEMADEAPPRSVG